MQLLTQCEALLLRALCQRYLNLSDKLRSQVNRFSPPLAASSQPPLIFTASSWRSSRRPSSLITSLGRRIIGQFMSACTDGASCQA